MSMIRKRSHPSGSGAKKEKAAQPETSNSHPPLLYFQWLMVYNFFSSTQSCWLHWLWTDCRGWGQGIWTWQLQEGTREQSLPSCISLSRAVLSNLSHLMAHRRIAKILRHTVWKPPVYSRVACTHVTVRRSMLRHVIKVQGTLGHKGKRGSNSRWGIWGKALQPW